MSSKDKKIQRDGLTAQEYSFKHALPLETIIDNNTSSKEHKISKILTYKEPNSVQKTILKAYHDLRLINIADNIVKINEDVRKLDYLFWINEQLKTLGFEFLEHSEYNEESHKVITENYIFAGKKNINFIELQNYKIEDFSLYLSIVLMCRGYISNKYIYLKDIDNNLHEIIKNNLKKENIDIVKLKVNKDFFIARIKSKKDSEKIKKYLDLQLKKIPCLYEKFYYSSPKAKITKKLVFDSAHFITDHEGKCKNLHGGRYDIEISIKDRIDPMTGFVTDYSLIKKITKNLVINKFDHKTLNFTCPELAWRSSTEFLAIVIWELLIEYMPNLKKIKIYETESSYCEYEGNSLDEYLMHGPSEILCYFKNLSRNNQKSKNTAST